MCEVSTAGGNVQVPAAPLETLQMVWEVGSSLRDFPEAERRQKSVSLCKQCPHELLKSYHLLRLHAMLHNFWFT